MSPRPVRARGSARRQGGVVLFVALIVLIIMTLAGLALLRQMGVGTSIAGNVAFKENATSVADRGTEWARAWLIANSAITSSDSIPNGYLSSWAGGVDPTAFDWDGQSRTLTDDQAQTGNTTRIIIQRLCATAGMSALDPAQNCSDFPMPNAPTSRGGGSYPSVLPGVGPVPFYRVTTRVDGPRNTVSYTQVLMQ
ncbi:MAG: pilus assembly PilX family protein [Caldimonas sp.]